MTATTISTQIALPAPAAAPTLPRHLWAGDIVRLRAGSANYRWQLLHTFIAEPCPCERCQRTEGIWAVRNRAGRYRLTSLNDGSGYTLSCVGGRHFIPAD